MYLFAYGTLRRVLAPPELRELMETWRDLGRGTVPGRLYDLGAYPGAVLDSAGSTSIVGEVYQLPNGHLDRLDQYEGFDGNDESASLFVRRSCLVALDDGQQLACSIYVYNGETSSAEVIANGDYLYAKSR
ncbi:MAG TPA: gamma-glutamylcyclotransferase family protein [Blastocatellia bacterium]|nr:gamma-glutamylcyclotransferase family protein [Blastocatellia bacterium]